MNTVRNRLEILDSVLMHGAVCAEIGVFEGDFSQQILARTNPNKLHLIDIWCRIGNRTSVPGKDAKHADRLGQVSLRCATAIKQRRVMIHQGYSAEVMTLLPPGYFDWVYVDGGHLYNDVYRDLECCQRGVKSGGHIACHDYALPHQKNAIQQGGGAYLPDIARAVHDFCDKHDWEVFCVSEIGPMDGEDPTGNHCPTCVLRRK
jgi:hypothetical protein